MPSAIRNPKSLYESCLHSFTNHFATCTRKSQIKTLTDEVVKEETCVSKCVVNPVNPFGELRKLFKQYNWRIMCEPSF